MYFWFCHRCSEVVRAFNDEGNYHVNESNSLEDIISLIKEIDVVEIHRPTDYREKLRSNAENLEKIKQSANLDQEQLADLIYTLNLFDFSTNLNSYQVKNLKDNTSIAVNISNGKPVCKCGIRNCYHELVAYKDLEKRLGLKEGEVRTKISKKDLGFIGTKRRVHNLKRSGMKGGEEFASKQERKESKMNVIDSQIIDNLESSIEAVASEEMVNDKSNSNENLDHSPTKSSPKSKTESKSKINLSNKKTQKRKPKRSSRTCRILYSNNTKSAKKNNDDSSDTIDLVDNFDFEISDKKIEKPKKSGRKGGEEEEKINDKKDLIKKPSKKDIKKEINKEPEDTIVLQSSEDEISILASKILNKKECKDKNNDNEDDDYEVKLMSIALNDKIDSQDLTNLALSNRWYNVSLINIWYKYLAKSFPEKSIFYISPVIFYNFKQQCIYISAHQTEIKNLLFPINTDKHGPGLHWILGYISFEKQFITILDSGLPMKDSQYLRFFQRLNITANIVLKSSSKTINRFFYLLPRDTPRQENGHDCGPRIMWMSYLMCKNSVELPFDGFKKFVSEIVSTSQESDYYFNVYSRNREVNIDGVREWSDENAIDNLASQTINKSLSFRSIANNF